MLSPLKEFDWTFANIPAGSLIQTIVCAGCDSEDADANKRARIINALCLITAFLCFTIAPLLYYITGYKSILIPGLIEGTLFFLVILLNRLYFHRTASISVLAVHLICALYFGLILGKDSPVVLIIGFMFALCFLIYDKKKEAWTGASLALLTFVSLEICYYNNFVTPIQLSNANQYQLRWIVFPCFLFLFVLVVLRYVKVYTSLQQLNKAYVRNTAHDQRININAGIAVVNALEEKITRNPMLSQVYPYIKLFESVLDDMHEAANNTLSFAEIEAGRQLKILHDSFSHKDLLDKFMETKEISARDKGKKLTLTIQKNFPEILIGDPNHLKSIYSNLISNAIKYGEDGNMIYIDLGVLESGEYYTFSVTNQCPDIPPTTLEKLFSLFETNPNNKQVESSGVGLYIVKNTIEAMGGNVSAISNKGKTTFTVTLPLVAGEASNSHESKVEEVYNLNLKGMLALVAEDNGLIFHGIKTKLEAFGCDVIGYKDGESCQKALEKNQVTPNLIFLDKNLPGKNGRNILKYIKETPALDHIPVFLISGEFSNDSVLDLLALGASELLLKPIKTSDLNKVFLRFLNDQQLIELKHA